MESVRQIVARRHREGDFTEAEIINLAGRRDFYVHIYRWKHTKLRQLTRRMLKEGKLDLVARYGDDRVYRVPGTYNKEDYRDDT